MTSLFLAPATGRSGAYNHFCKTILEGVPQERYSQFIDEKKKHTRIWGLSSSFKSTWKNAKRGDWVLFYTQKNQYEYAGQIISKQHNSEFGESIREDFLENVSKDRDWDYLLFFDEPIEISVSGDTISELVNYSNSYPVRFIRVANKRLDVIETQYGGVDKFINSIRR